MFQFPRLPTHGYVFTMRSRGITRAGFSHSEIHGSKAVQRLTVAYRSRPRPSSSPGAKASTVCPYYLDGELLVREYARALLQYLLRLPRCQWGDARTPLLSRS